MIGETDPVRLGFGASPARPGGNITGVASNTGEGFEGKGLELLKEAVPEVSHMAILRDVAIGIGLARRKDLQATAAALGAQLLFFEVRNPDEFEGAFAAMTAKGAGALRGRHTALFHANRPGLAELAARRRLPMIYGDSAMVHAGGLMSYAVHRHALYRRAATYVDKILKGAKPGDQPVEQPMTFELVINLNTANALGITIPPTLLFLADEVIR